MAPAPARLDATLAARKDPSLDLPRPRPEGVVGTGQRWQALQLSPGLKCFIVGPWQETQFIAAVCHAGLGGDVGWPAVSLWQTAQPPLACTGTWQFLQWSFRGAFQPAP